MRTFFFAIPICFRSCLASKRSLRTWLSWSGASPGSRRCSSKRAISCSIFWYSSLILLERLASKYIWIMSLARCSPILAINFDFSMMTLAIENGRMIAWNIWLSVLNANEPRLMTSTAILPACRALVMAIDAIALPSPSRNLPANPRAFWLIFSANSKPAPNQMFLLRT